MVTGFLGRAGKVTPVPDPTDDGSGTVSLGPRPGAPARSGPWPSPVGGTREAAEGGAAALGGVTGEAGGRTGASVVTAPAVFDTGAAGWVA